ncbi:hypothetical protein YA0089_25985 [Pseudomonas viridiflava]|uniref:hypothetical protein n=1 Tax=Pseudomonas viridiflava TaxID=33069 RepID=UPI0018E5BFCB|nr:hypothetical protein [Pseudomonas viridiflava]MBI6727066.1 hypothetical protein [Pseudomonas viridiflava]
MKKEVKDFLEAVPKTMMDMKSQWFKQGHLNVYLRKGFTYLSKDSICVSVTLSSCEVTSRKFLGKGNVKNILPEFETFVKDLGYEAIIAENIIPHQLREYMSRNGYQDFNRGQEIDISSTLIKLL